MTEAELQAAVIEMAQLFGWKVAHFRPARTEKGWVTPVAADGKGFPDLCMVHPDKGILFAELKSEKGRVTREQGDWLIAIQHASGNAFLWCPSDWRDGLIQEVLEEGPQE